MKLERHRELLRWEAGRAKRSPKLVDCLPTGQAGFAPSHKSNADARKDFSILIYVKDKVDLIRYEQ